MFFKSQYQANSAYIILKTTHHTQFEIACSIICQSNLSMKEANLLHKRYVKVNICVFLNLLDRI